MFKVLLAFYTISSCGSVSSFCDTRKTELSFLKNNINNLIVFINSEDSTTLDFQDLECLEAVIWFVCLLYDKTIKYATINDFGFTIFSEKVQSNKKLPPTLGKLYLHLGRAAY